MHLLFIEKFVYRKYIQQMTRKISNEENWKNRNNIIIQYFFFFFFWLSTILKNGKRSSFWNHVPFQPLPILLSIQTHTFPRTTHTPSPSILPPSLLPSDKFDNLRIDLSHRCSATISSNRVRSRGETILPTPSLPLCPKTKEDLSKREDNGGRAYHPVYISAVLSSVNWETGKSSNGFVWKWSNTFSA